jgi:hypothetical protein
MMWEVEALRRAAVFGRSHADIALSAGGSVVTRAVDTTLKRRGRFVIRVTGHETIPGRRKNP